MLPVQPEVLEQIEHARFVELDADEDQVDAVRIQGRFRRPT
ncbi:MAG: hypothetical protein ACT4P4_09655 [Betaproteobacteria bacterium]